MSQTNENNKENKMSIKELFSEEFEKHYDFKKYEPLVEEYWQKYDFYNKQLDEFIEAYRAKEIQIDEAKKRIFVIDTPPPTVNADGMHIGHAFSYSHIDFVARFQRMNSRIVYFPFGFDDNGLPTERFVEKKFGKKASEIPRDEFRELCYKVIKETEEKFAKFWIRMGLSADFRNPYSTISKEVIKLSQISFVELYEQGRIYRKDSPVLWCPECKTAISQTELEDKELESTFNDIIFKILDDEGNEIEDLIIATTRPELLPACVAVFVHPDDERYKHLIGKKAKTPLFNDVVPILADERVDPEKGTGAVMCCTFGDQTDIEWYKAYNLPLKEAITEDGKMTKLAGKYEGVKIEEARQAIIEDLKKENLLVGQRPIVHTVNVHERCKTPIEILSRPQWFIKYLDLKDKFLELGEKLNWHPKHMKHRYDNWVKGLQWDWCISRQRYFGVPIPVWYCENGHIIVAKKDELPVDPTVDKKEKCPICGGRLTPDYDVLDTWATSSLTPMIISKWKTDEEFFKLTFPNSLRPQAHDIISFWLFNTVVKSWLHEKSLPWTDVAISGYVLAADGSKMSKSKGNVVDPWDVINEYGSDALRFWAASSKLGEDLPIEEKEFINARKFFTKLWNASKFVKINIKKYYEKYDDVPYKYHYLEKWLLTKLTRVINASTKAFENYDYSKSKQYTEKFFKQIYCDNYLEFIKPYFWNIENVKDIEHLRGIVEALKQGLLNTLKLLAPIVPHITEIIYHKVFDVEIEKSIHLEKWPDPILMDEHAEAVGDLFAKIVSAVRKYKGLKQMKLKEPIDRIDVALPKQYTESMLELDELLKEITKAKEINYSEAENLDSVEIRVNGEIIEPEYKPDYFSLPKDE